MDYKLKTDLKKLEASDLTATQVEIATVARFLVWRDSQYKPCAEPEAIKYRFQISKMKKYLKFEI